MVDHGVSSQTINATIRGLRFFFEITLDRPQALKRMSPVRVPDKLPLVLSVEDVTRLFNAASNVKSTAALSVAYDAGLRASEVCHLKVNDIDSERMVIHVEHGKGSRDRQAMLSPALLPLLRVWWQEGHRLGKIFFFVVGLEIKREIVMGERSGLKSASIPVIAAIGGMAVPAALYWAINMGTEGARGWGIPMATDIAFAVGLIALLGRRVPKSLITFLVVLAIVDDLGAVSAITLFYTESIEMHFVGAAILMTA